MSRGTKKPKWLKRGKWVWFEHNSRKIIDYYQRHGFLYILFKGWGDAVMYDPVNISMLDTDIERVIIGCERILAKNRKSTWIKVFVSQKYSERLVYVYVVTRRGNPRALSERIYRLLDKGTRYRYNTSDERKVGIEICADLNDRKPVKVLGYTCYFNGSGYIETTAVDECFHCGRKLDRCICKDIRRRRRKGGLVKETW